MIEVKETSCTGLNRRRKRRCGGVWSPNGRYIYEQTRIACSGRWHSRQIETLGVGEALIKGNQQLNPVPQRLRRRGTWLDVGDKDRNSSRA